MRRPNSTHGVSATKTLTAVLAGLSMLVTTGCREGSDQQSADFIPLSLPTAGNHGCATPNQGFSGAAFLQSLDLGGFALASTSRLAASSAEPLLFMTGANAAVLQLDVTDTNATVPTVLVDGGVIDALLATAGVSQPAVLSGVAVVDEANLVVIEHTSNTLLLVSRLVPNTVDILAGFPNTNGGLADGFGAQIRFNFEDPTAVVPTGDGLLYVADSGNHVIRQVRLGTFPEVVTITGTGAPGYRDGSLASSQFDTPNGLSIACDGRLLVTESGAQGFGGHRLRAVSIGSGSFFGGFNGFVETLAGNGISDSLEGVGTDAGLAGPSAVFSTANGEVYFVDGDSGHPRRYTIATGLVDCPMEALGCTMGGGFLSGNSNVGLTVDSAFRLYFLLGADGDLVSYSPF